MAWIKTTSEQDATGRLREIYDTIREGMPIVPNIMQSLSLKNQCNKCGSKWHQEFRTVAAKERVPLMPRSPRKPCDCA